jgi:hypothetical protein
MLADILIFSSCFVALIVWARYAILTILENGRNPDDAAMLVRSNNLEFLRVRENLQEDPQAPGPPKSKEYRQFAEALKYDLMAASYLARASTRNGKARSYSLQESLLVWNFLVMRAVCSVGRFFSTSLARFAMLEMIAVVEYFAGMAGRRMRLEVI